MTEWQERRAGWTAQAEDARSEFDVDYARVIHSASFRRLQGKTQILNLGDSDFYRTRLTHSLEVAQIATGIVRQFHALAGHPAVPYLPDHSLIQAIGLAHDLGHPPFGHGGEVALNYCMRDHGGFEGNGQTLRILSRLEKFSDSHGSNLTRRAMLGIIKYPVAYGKASNPSLRPCLDTGPTAISIIRRCMSHPPKCFLNSEQDVFDWIVAPLTPNDRDRFLELVPNEDGHAKTVHKSFDCSVMDLADDIAYGVHDLEDVIALALVSENDFRASVTEDACGSFLDALKAKYPGESGNDVYERFVGQLFADGGSRKRFIGRLVHHLVTNAEIRTDEAFVEPLLRYRADLPEGPKKLLKALKNLVRDKVILSPRVQHLEFKGQRMVVSVFEVFQSEPKSFLPEDAYRRYADHGNDLRVICDHVAGMTDTFLLKTYERLFSPRMGSVFDRL